jgi:hypothetical protein
MPGIPDMPLVPGMSGTSRQPRFGGGGAPPLMLILVVILGIGTFVFGIMTIVAFGQASKATNTLKTQTDKVVTAAKADQKKQDDDATAKAAESPYRSYVAPIADGSFEIKFPKSWSSYVDEENYGTQVSLVINPDSVRRSNGTDQLAAAKITLQQRSQTDYLNAFQSLLQSGALKQATISVSGLKAFDITGNFQDKRTTRQVVVPVRDKVLVFVNENSKYASEFGQILAQSKVNP